MDDANDWHKIADERAAEIVRLTGELHVLHDELDELQRALAFQFRRGHSYEFELARLKQRFAERLRQQQT